MTSARPWLPSLSFFALALLLSAVPPAAWAQLPVGPVQGYVYIEPFEVRKEAAFYLRALPEWRERVERGESITQEQRQGILEELAARFKDACPLEIDGQSPVFDLDQMHFLRLLPDLGAVPDDRETIPAAEALVALVYATAQDHYPAEVTLKWDFFPGEVREVPVTFVSRSKRLTLNYAPDGGGQTFALPANEAEPVLLEVPAPPASHRVRVPVLSLVLLTVAVGCGLGARFYRPAGPVLGLVAVGGLLVAIFTWGLGGVEVRDPYAEPVTVDEVSAREVVEPLLRNIYHAFDYRTESRIYDTLEASVEGQLLEQIYLDIRKGLELEELGGPRVRVENLDIRNVAPEPLGQRDGFRADVEWVALGNVTHWGHVHRRLNKYHAWLEIEPVNGQWQLTRIEIIEEGRLPG